MQMYRNIQQQFLIYIYIYIYIYIHICININEELERLSAEGIIRPVTQPTDRVYYSYNQTFFPFRPGKVRLRNGNYSKVEAKLYVGYQLQRFTINNVSIFLSNYIVGFSKEWFYKCL